MKKTVQKTLFIGLGLFILSIKMQLAIITLAIGNSARLGQKMFKDNPVDFRVFVRLLPNANIWATLAKSMVKRFSDFKGQKIAVEPASGGLGVIARAQLQANSIDYKKDITPMFLGAGDIRTRFEPLSYEP